jgi:hypothetical protein
VDTDYVARDAGAQGELVPAHLARSTSDGSVTDAFFSPPVGYGGKDACSGLVTAQLPPDCGFDIGWEMP